MRIFKFGGASVKDANGIKNLIKVLSQVGYDNTFIIVSAMGKTTNALELVIDKYFNHPEALHDELELLKTSHVNVLNDLFESKHHQIYDEINSLFEELKLFFKTNKSPNYNFVYDQVICYGELLSTKIISYYLNNQGYKSTWLDVRTCIKTDDFYRRANVNWDKTKAQITQNIDKNSLVITQGFIASDANNFTTTLGREGSDYTAAIFAYCLNAESVTIWKDVEGVLNADPRYFKETQLLNTISYTEAIELAFYGASVIHPKTLQPLQRKEIPLYVKSFLNPDKNGTVVNKSVGIEPEIPCYILKQNVVLVSLSTLDFSYIVEKNISAIFNALAHYKMKVDVIQNSAISFSVCFENHFNNLDALLLELKSKFNVVCHENVSLYTIRHYQVDSEQSIVSGKEILLKQQLNETLQIVTK